MAPRFQIKNIVASLCNNLAKERPRWPLWIPLALGNGVSLYLGWPYEPPLVPTLALLGLAIFLALFGIFKENLFNKFISWAFLWMALGFAWIMINAHWINPRPLSCDWGPRWIEGIVHAIDHTASKTSLYQRLVFSPRHSQLPKSTTLHVRTHSVPLYPGDRIRLKAKFEPLPRASLVHGYDAERENFFRGIGARGYSMTAVTLLSRTSKGFFSQVRQDLTRIFYQRLPTPLGAMACALVTGDKLALDPALRQDFSDSGLSHILAIAGLHMALLSSLCFLAFRRLFVFRSGLLSGEILGGVITLCMAWAYMMLSGQRYPTLRAFTMMTAGFMALWAGRPRQSLRILLFTATLFLVFEPYAWATLSYQLSFGAVAGLMAIQPLRWQIRASLHIRPKRQHPWKRKSIRFIKDALWANVAIALATWPVMAYHFSHVSFQGLISNMVAIPWTAVFVLPLGLLSLCLLHVPYLSQVALTLWGWSLHGLIFMAQTSARCLKGWVWHQNSFPTWALHLEMLGLFWFFIWKGSWRWVGVFFTIVLHTAYQIGSPVPSLMWSSGLFGSISQKTLCVTSLRAKKFTQNLWKQTYGLHDIKMMDLPFRFTFKGVQALLEKTPSGFCIQGPFGPIHFYPETPACLIFKNRIEFLVHNRLWHRIDAKPLHSIGKIDQEKRTSCPS